MGKPPPKARKQSVLGPVAAVVGALLAGLILVVVLNLTTKDAEVSLPPVELSSAVPRPVCDNASPPLLSMREIRDRPYPMSIDVDANYEAEVSTSCGTMRLKLYAQNAPHAVNNFVNLAQDNFFTGMVFHRIDRELGIIQSGDPGCPTSIEECGRGGPGYVIPDEWRNGLKAGLGSVFMASGGTPNSSGSQFEIVAADTKAKIPVQRTVFGSLLGGHSQDVAAIILSVPTQVAPAAVAENVQAPADYPSGEFVYITAVKVRKA